MSWFSNNNISITREEAIKINKKYKRVINKSKELGCENKKLLAIIEEKSKRLEIFETFKDQRAEYEEKIKELEEKLFKQETGENIKIETISKSFKEYDKLVKNVITKKQETVNKLKKEIDKLKDGKRVQNSNIEKYEYKELSDDIEDENGDEFEYLLDEILIGDDSDEEPLFQSKSKIDLLT